MTNRKWFGFALSATMAVTLISGLPAPSSSAVGSADIATSSAEVAANLVAKTILVRGADGEPYQGVHVGLVRHDPSIGTDVILPGETAVTGSDGVAVLEIPSLPTSGNYVGISIQPPATDLSVATHLIQGHEISRQHQSFEIQLENALFAVELKTASGNHVAVGTAVGFEYGTDSEGEGQTLGYVLRPGPFTLGSGVSRIMADLQQYPADWRFSISVRATDQSFAAHWYNFEHNDSGFNMFDPSGAAVGSNSDDVFQLTVDSPQVQGTLVVPDGQLPDFDAAWVSVGGYGGVWSPVDPDTGAFNLLLPSRPGEYRPTFNFAAGSGLPTFMGPAIQLNSSGEIAIIGDDQEPGFAAPSTLEYVVEVPQASTFSVEIDEPSVVHLFIHGTSGSIFISHPASSGEVSWFINPDQSEIEFSITPNNRTQRGSNGTIWLQTDGELEFDLNRLARVEGSNKFLATTENPAVLLAPVDSAGVALNAYCWGDCSTFMGVASIFEAFGAQPWPRTVTLEPSSFEGPNRHAASNFYIESAGAAGEFHVYSGSSPDPATKLLEVDGVFEVEMNELYQISGAIFTPGGQKLTAGEAYQVHLEYLAPNDENWQNVWAEHSSASGGDFEIVLSDEFLQYQGSTTLTISDVLFRVVIDPRNLPSAARTISETFVFAAGTRVLRVNDITLTASNLRLISTFDGAQVDARVEIFSGTNRVVSDALYAGAPLGFYLNPGEYTIKLLPEGGLKGAKQTAFSLSVVAVEGGLSTATVVGVEPELDGVFDLELAQGGLTLRLVDPRQQDADTGVPGVWVEGPSAWGETDEFGEFHIPVTDPGEYWLWINDDWRTGDLRGGHYRLVISSNEAGALYEITEQGSTSTAVGVDGSTLLIQMKAVNFIGRVTKAAGVPFVNWESGDDYAWVTLYRKDSAGNWTWSASAGLDDNGQFKFHIGLEGEYRIDVRVNGASGLASTSFDLGVIDGPALPTALNEVQDFGDFQLRSANVNIRLINPDTGGSVAYGDVSLARGSSFVAWQYAGSTGRVSFFLEPGEYELTVHPPWNSGFVPKIYPLVVDANGVASVAGLSYQDGFLQVPLGSPSLTGLVLHPDPAIGAIKWASVVPVEVETGRELWEYSTQTNQNGRWIMGLPQGQYQLYAMAPWDSRLGNSLRSEILSVDADGVVTLEDGSQPTSFDLRLQYPTWSGVLLRADGSAASSAWVCMDFSDYGNCASTDSAGRWGLSAPEGFKGFTSTSGLTANDYSQQTPELRVRGVQALSDILGSYSPGEIYTDITLRLPSSNLTVKTNGLNGPVANVWVNLHSQSGEWLGAGQTGQDGKAKFFVDNIESGFWVWVHPDSAGEAARDLYKSGRFDFVASPGVESRELELQLPLANFWGRVLNPDGSAVAHSWVEVTSEDSYEWFEGGSTNDSGLFSLLLPQPSSGVTKYRVTVRPDYNSNQDFGRKTYLVTVGSNGSTSVQDLAGSPVANQIISGRTRYLLTTAPASLAGVVVDPSGNLVRDSWVTPITFEFGWRNTLWQDSTSSREGGRFAMALPDGRHWIEAHSPSQNLVRSAPCEVILSNGSVDPSGTTCWNAANERVELSLRQPNLKFKLVNASGAPVRYASVSLGYGSWWEHVHSNDRGEVNLFVDTEEIKRINSWLEVGDSIQLHLGVNPPWQSKGLVGWNCTAGTDQPVCKDIPALVIGETFEARNLGTYEFLTSNFDITVLNPSTGDPVGADAWVSLGVTGVDPNCSWCWQSLGYAQTDEDGKAGFYVPTEYADIDLARFHLNINPPWQERNLSAATYGDLTYDQLAVKSFALNAPNANLTVYMPDGETPVGQDAWLWLSASDSASGCSQCRWSVGWTSTDADGKAGFFVPDNYLNSSTVTFNLSISPPWHQRQGLAETEYVGLSLEDLQNGQFTVKSPNLGVKVLQSTGLVARWSSVHIEEVELVEGMVSYKRWVAGVGTDQAGAKDLYLNPETTYRMQAWPGSSAQGASVSCVFSLDEDNLVQLLTDRCEAGVVSSSGGRDVLTLTLGAGNVSGVVTGVGGRPVSGAIVYATHSGKTTQTAVTKADGSYSIALEPGQEWTIKVFVDPDSGLGSDTVGRNVQISSSGTHIFDFTLAAAEIVDPADDD